MEPIDGGSSRVLLHDDLTSYCELSAINHTHDTMEHAARYLTVHRQKFFPIKPQDTAQRDNPALIVLYPYVGEPGEVIRNPYSIL